MIAQFSTKKITLTISSLLFCITFSFSQPYLYFPRQADEEQDERNVDIYRLNLQTGASEIAVVNVGRVVQLFSNSDHSKLFIQGRGYLNVLELRDNFPQKTIIDGIEWVHDIVDVQQTKRVYVSIGTDESYKKTIVLDRSTYDTVGIITKFMSFHKPFMSNDASKFFRFIPDSSGIIFDVYNSLTGSRIIENKRCGNIGPFAYNPGFFDGKRGTGIARIRLKKKDDWITQQFVVCSPEDGVVSGIIPFPLRSEAVLSSDAKRVIIEEVQFINDNDPNTPPEYRPGNVFVFDAQSGMLLQKLNLPPEGKILLFDNYPDKLFYLTGTEGNFHSIQVSLNIVTPVLTLVDTLIALTNQSYRQKWIGDANLVKELTNHLENAKKHLNKKDSLKCVQEVEKFQSKVDKEYKEANTSDNRFVTLEGWKFLYFNALYIIERLVTLPAKPTGTLLQQIDGLKAEVQNQSKKKNLGGVLLTTSLTLLADQAKRELQKKDSIETAVYITLFQLLVDEIYDATVALEAIKKSAKLLYVKDEAYIALHYRSKYILEALPPLPLIDLNAQRSQKVDKQLLNEMEQMKKEE